MVRTRGGRAVFSMRSGLLFVLLALMNVGPAAGGPEVPDLNLEDLMKVKVYRLVTDPLSEQPVVLLSDPMEELALPIWIGYFEANAIASEMNGVEHSRPLTHDLLEQVIREARLTIVRVVVTHRSANTYYAEILMRIGGSQVRIDARPSDSIALALKFKTPIYVSKDLFREAAVPIGEGKEGPYGLSLQDLTRSLAKAFSYESTRGVLVSDVRKGSRAEADGLQRGDIIVEAGGQAVEDLASLRGLLEASKASVKVKVFRKGAFLSLILHPTPESGPR